MKRILFVSMSVVAVLGAVFSLAAMPPKAQSDLPDLSGKVVVLERPGTRWGARENVRFETVGEKAFAVLPTYTGTESEHESWVPLDELRGLRVFETMAAAEAYEAAQLGVVASKAADEMN